MLPEEDRYRHLLSLAGNQQLNEKLVEAMNAIEDHGGRTMDKVTF